MTRCPTCGGPMAPKDRSAELWRLLNLAGRGVGAPLNVYRINNSTRWAITYTRGVTFAPEDVMRLVREGKLAPVYPGTEGERDCYGHHRADHQSAAVRAIGGKR